MQSYNTIVSFDTGEEIMFEDFSLRYIKQRSVPGPNNAKWTMTFFDFKINGSCGVQQLHWSSGTGRIAPRLFTYNNLEFLLILGVFKTNKTGSSDSFIKLNQDQLIIQKVVP